MKERKFSWDNNAAPHEIDFSDSIQVRLEKYYLNGTSSLIAARELSISVEEVRIRLDKIKADYQEAGRILGAERLAGEYLRILNRSQERYRRLEEMVVKKESVNIFIHTQEFKEMREEDRFQIELLEKFGGVHKGRGRPPNQKDMGDVMAVLKQETEKRQLPAVPAMDMVLRKAASDGFDV